MKFTRTLLACSVVALLAACSGQGNTDQNPAGAASAPPGASTMQPSTAPATTPEDNGSMAPEESSSSMAPMPSESASSAMPADNGSSASSDWDNAKDAAKNAASSTGDAIKSGASAAADKAKDAASKAKDAMNGG